MAPEQYGAGEELAYRGTRQEWAGLLGSSHAQLRGMRRILLGMVLVLALSVCSTFAIVLWKRQVVVYGIETDHIGQVTLRGPLKQEYIPNDASIQFHLRQFVELVRRATADPPLTNQGRQRAYWFATRRGGEILRQHFDAMGSPAALAKEGTIAVEVTSALKVSSSSWQLDWIERKRDRQGNAVGETMWRGSFRVRLHAPKDEEQLEQNPIGVFVDDFNWVRIKG